MIDEFKNLPEEDRKKLKKKKQPGWTEPMLAKLTDERFSDPDWIYERKLDGERCLAFAVSKKITLKSRNNKKINVSYPEIAEALEKTVQEDCILDGEIVAFEGRQTSFAKLQHRMHVKSEKEAEKGAKVFYYVFDILHAGGYDLTGIPLIQRRRVLKHLISYEAPLRYLPYRKKEGEKLFKQACRKGWEGIIAKDGKSHYTHSRSSKWLKFKCVHEQEFVIGGYTDPQGSRIGLGAVLIGYYKGNSLKYAGKAGTGFDDETLKRLGRKLRDSRVDHNPFDAGNMEKKNVNWVKPEMVAQIGFTEWTEDGKLRHPRFLGLRRDKSPKEVKREKP